MGLDECEAKSVLCIAEDLRRLEPGLYETKWLDYRRLHPAVATAVFAEEYRKAYGRAIIRWFNHLDTGRTGLSHGNIFKLDSGAGADSVTFHQPAVEKLKLLEGRQTTPSKKGGVGGFVQSQSGKLEWFEIGGKRHEDVSVTFATEAKGAFANPYITGNLGGTFIKPFNLVLDYQNGRIAYVER